MAEIKRRHSFDEVFDSQKVFRLILTAVSNPGRIVNIRPFGEKLYGDEPELLALAMTLLDNEVSFHVCGSALSDGGRVSGGGLSGVSGLAEDIISLTLSKQADLENADYIFITDPAMLENAIKNAKCGTLQDPHKSATLIVEVDGNDAGRNFSGKGGGRTCGQSAAAGTCALRLSGPGIKGTAEFAVPELAKTALDIRDSQCYEYPQGIDMIFVSEDGSLFAVPRLTRKEAV